MYPLKTKYPYNPGNLEATWNIFTTVYLWNYVPWNFDEWAGSHLWVDIIPQIKHDPIFACMNWVVQFAWTSDSNWHYIILRHPNAPDPNNLAASTVLYSCHLHLSELLAKTWDQVKEWDIIWKSGNTWNSTWEHLHFQIDTWNAPFHPYWPFTLKEANEAWLGFFEAVNAGLGIENARKYTIDPLVYLDKISNIQRPIITSDPTPKAVPAFSTKSRYFTDVSDNVEEIDYLAEKWITKGYWDNTFRPNSNITRAELLAMTFIFGWIRPEWSISKFTDVASTDWFSPYVTAAVAKWFISWYPDNTFKPNNAVTRAEAIAIVLNIAVGKNKIPSAADSLYQDVKTSDWFCRYANYVSENWLLDSIGKFYPSDNLKRSDFAVLLYNLK
ncbi:MAG: hypothetical protein ACD_2C00221G0017 [uncultured bacterium (gcode 4)]|uniref:SLH domain-containing protein n=1 Tax=uncultured bacterium (gcode 4) TaxID=1234023 RepID=K2H069_9BACT|nr:MAG: hypothetical protein ACD_2C00221G0017 [uncultured bacterium (gcode 4)]